MTSIGKCNITLTTSPEDWKIIRECYVQSFRHYPLYKYMVPDESKRDKFLRAYLDANYEVTVESNQGILLAVRAHEINNNGVEALESKLKVVGGVVLVPPALDGRGWATADDELYWKAYQKYNLASISAEGFRRVKRYEAWESSKIGQKLIGAKIPAWNGFFCALKPDYTSRGLGSAVYKHAINLMKQYWVKQQSDQPVSEIKLQENRFRDVHKHPEKKLMRRLSVGLFCKLSDITECSYSNSTTFKREILRKTKFSFNALRVNSQTLKPKLISKNVPNKRIDPLVVVVTHSERAANFYKSNGFQPVAKLPYVDNVDESVSFFTYVLVLDPFKTGGLNKFSLALNTNTTANNYYFNEILNNNVRSSYN